MERSSRLRRCGRGVLLEGVPEPGGDLDVDVDGLVVGRRRECRHAALARPVERDRDPQHARKGTDQRLVIGRQGHELGVGTLGRALAVIPGDLGDELDLTVGESGELIAVADDVVGVLVVRGVGDEQSHVVQQRRRLQQVACGEVETVGLVERIEQRQREIGGGLDVRDVLVEDLGHTQHRLAADVAEVTERRFAVAHRHVQEHPLAQGGLGHGHRFDGEPVEDLLEQDRAGDDDVDTLVLEAGACPAGRRRSTGSRCRRPPLRARHG